MATVKPIKVTIDEATTTYHLFMTSAPKAYDHGGTLEVPDAHPDARVVLVPEDAVEWSRGRYGSGLHAFCDMDDEWLRDEVCEWLWRRLRGLEDNDD